MEYINGTITGVQGIGPKKAEKTIDSRRYLSEMTWEEIEKQYLKPIAKGINNGRNITGKGNSNGIQSYPER